MCVTSPVDCLTARAIDESAAYTLLRSCAMRRRLTIEHVAAEILTGLQNKTPVDMSGVTTTEKTIAEDGRTVKLYIMKPRHPAPNLRSPRRKLLTPSPRRRRPCCCAT